MTDLKIVSNKFSSLFSQFVSSGVCGELVPSNQLVSLGRHCNISARYGQERNFLSWLLYTRAKATEEKVYTLR